MFSFGSQSGDCYKLLREREFNHPGLIAIRATVRFGPLSHLPDG